MDGPLASWLHKQKDSTVSFLAERALQHYLKRYGRMLKFYLDSRNKTAQCEILLAGEKDPITVLIQEYELKNTGTGTVIVIRKATASREWLHLVMQDFLLGKEFPLPDKFAPALKLLA